MSLPGVLVNAGFMFVMSGVLPGYSMASEPLSDSVGERGDSASTSSDVRLSDESSLAATVLSSRQPAESLLQGRRLFFTPAQRRLTDAESGYAGNRPWQADSDVVPVQSGSDAKSQLIPTEGTEKHSRENTAKVPARSAVGVYFDGLVSSSDGIQLLVNGLPCRSLLQSHGVRTDVDVKVDCPGVEQSHPRLSLTWSGDRLTIASSGSVVGILAPGQGL